MTKNKQSNPSTSSSREATATEQIVLGNFHSILDESQTWRVGGFKLADGSYWEYREPDATVIVRNNTLYVRAKLSRQHNQVQILDNAKHMYFSQEAIHVPEHGEISFELQMRARCKDTNPDDFYDGFVSLNLLDFTTGGALDFFVNNNQYSSVYAVLPFPGVTVPETSKTKNFCIFKEEETHFMPGEFNTYRIVYNRAHDEAVFFVNGHEVRREQQIPVKFNEFYVCLGIMTEQDIGPQGSISVHGQTIIAEYSPVTIEMKEKL